MAETAAHLVDHVFPPLPVRQWVLSVPKRLRYFLEREPRAVSAVLHIFLRVIEANLRQTSPGAGAQARLGAISFVHRFGSALNRHVHYHCCIIDGLFEPIDDGQVRFLHAPALTAGEIAGIGEPAQAPPIAPARGPPALDDALADAVPDGGALAQPEPEYLFDPQV
jgi:hypothetical protein